MRKADAREIDARAALWAARIDAGPLSPERESELQAWLACDVRHPGAFARMRAVALITERARALGPEFIPASSPPVIGRRSVLLQGGAIAATALIGSVAWTRFQRASRFATTKGETKVIALKDGSVMTLNTSSEVVVSYSAKRRSVELTRGEVLFSVSKNQSRPFIVAAGDTRVTVVGTSFSVQHLDTKPVQVLVQEGVVEVSKPALPYIRPIRLSANMRAVAQYAQSRITTQVVAPTELHRALAWQDGKIAFEDQTLAQAATEFARYSDIKIIIADSDLAKEEISGLYRANDPVGFAETVAISLNAKISIEEGEVRLSR